MTTQSVETYLPRLSTTIDACAWLAAETDQSWTLVRLLESSVMPWVWLDYTPAFADLFGARHEGFLAPVVFAGDTQRLAVDGETALLSMTRTPDDVLVKFGPPGMRFPASELRWKKEDIEHLARLTEDESKPPRTASSATTNIGVTIFSKNQILKARWNMPKGAPSSMKNILENKPDWVKPACKDDGARGQSKGGGRESMWDVVLLCKLLGQNGLARKNWKMDVPELDTVIDTCFPSASSERVAHRDYLK